MEVTEYKIRDGYRVSFELALDRKGWEPYLENASAALQKSRPIKNFRKGKAPLPVAEKEYGELLYLWAARRAGEDGINQACEEHGLLPVSVPNITPVLADATGYSSIVQFDTYPKLSGIEYRGITIERPVHTVTDEDVEAEMESYVSRHLRVEETDDPARMNDVVEVDFTGTHNGERFPFDHADSFREILGTDRLFAGLDEVLVGKKKGDSFDITLTMPEDFHRGDIAGFTLDLHFNVHGVWARSSQTLSDEFVREYVNGMDTVEEFRASTREKLEEKYAKRTDSQFKKNVEDALANCITGGVPRSMVETVLERYMDAYEKLAGAQGKTTDELFAEEGTSREEYIKKSMPEAIKRVKLSLAVDSVISGEGFTVSQDEIDAYYKRRLGGTGIDVEEYKEKSGGDETAVHNILEMRAFRFVIDNANIVDVETPADEILKQPEE